MREANSIGTARILAGADRGRAALPAARQPHDGPPVDQPAHVPGRVRRAHENVVGTGRDPRPQIQAPPLPGEGRPHPARRPAVAAAALEAAKRLHPPAAVRSAAAGAQRHVDREHAALIAHDARRGHAETRRHRRRPGPAGREARWSAASPAAARPATAWPAAAGRHRPEAGPAPRPAPPAVPRRRGAEGSAVSGTGRQGRRRGATRCPGPDPPGRRRGDDDSRPRRTTPTPMRAPRRRTARRRARRARRPSGSRPCRSRRRRTGRTASARSRRGRCSPR